MTKRPPDHAVVRIVTRTLRLTPAMILVGALVVAASADEFQLGAQSAGPGLTGETPVGTAGPSGTTGELAVPGSGASSAGSPSSPGSLAPNPEIDESSDSPPLPPTPGPSAATDVAILSPLLDTLEAGVSAGPGTTLGIATGLISIAIGPLRDVPGGADVATLISGSIADLQEPTADFQAVFLDAIADIRSLIAGLAVANPVLDRAINDAADAMLEFAQQYRSQIQPFDQLIVFYAGVLRSQAAGG